MLSVFVVASESSTAVSEPDELLASQLLFSVPTSCASTPLQSVGSAIRMSGSFSEVGKF